MENIRKAELKDTSRIAEILIFNNRVNYFPIFRCEEYSFGELQAVTLAEEYAADSEKLGRVYVYDDGIVRGLIQLNGREVEKLYVDTFFQGRGIGEKLLKYAVEEHDADFLWALEKNTRAIKFYERMGFYPTGDKKLEEDTTEYLIRMDRRK